MTAMTPSTRDARGFTLVELLLALFLTSALVLALVQLIDTSLSIWGRTEERRDLNEVGAGVLSLLARDLVELEAGPRGDLLADWWTFDLDGDQAAGAPLARVRLVKRPSRAELERRFADSGSDLVEVVWALLPDPAAPEGGGVLVRGERALDDDERTGFFEPGFFGSTGKPPGGATELVTGGVLWLELAFASQTSVVNDGWSVGDGVEDASNAWDGWVRDRLDLERTAFNAPAAGMPSAPEPGTAPLLPRRVQARLEIERPADVAHRPRLSEPMATEGGALRVDVEGRLPEPGAMVRVDEEWMEVLSVSGDRAQVRRGARGTQARAHAAGRTVHHGFAVQTEVVIPLYKDDWDL